jgi:hypothetical protein
MVRFPAKRAGHRLRKQIAEPTADGKFKINAQDVEELVANKGYHSGDVLVSALEAGVRSYIAEPDRGQRKPTDKGGQHAARFTAMGNGSGGIDASNYCDGEASG